MTLLVRYDSEDPADYHYEAWSKDEDTGEPKEIVFYTSKCTPPNEVQACWNQFKKLHTQPSYRKKLLSEYTIH